MPNTRIINDWYDATVTSDVARNARGQWSASATVFRRDRQTPLEPIYFGEGSTVIAAEDRAFAAARAASPRRRPEDWDTPE